MIKRTVFTLAAVALMATPAYAFHCPRDAAAIDVALANMTVSNQLKSEVTALRNKGMELHKAGNHEEAQNLLAQAMRALLESTKK